MRIQSLIFILLLLSTRSLWAACASPVGVAGELRFNSPALQYCNGTSWVTTSNSVDSSTCTGAQAGIFVWDSGLVSFKYCDGTNWNLMKGDAASGCTTAGNLIYDSGANKFKFGDGSSCFYVGATSGGGGDPCNGAAVGGSCGGSTNTKYAGTLNGKKYMTTGGACPLATTNEPTCNGGDASAGYYGPLAVATVTGFASTNATDGAANTTLIVTANTGQFTSTVSATRYCEALVLDGFSDWYVPAFDELNLLYPNKASFGFGTYSYLSSTMSSASATRAINFSSGAETSINYGSNNPFRCVRSYY